MRNLKRISERDIEKADLHSGDIVICNAVSKNRKGDVETTKILPLESRYYNTLILGPCGRGKTTQMILPMLQQDLANLDCGVTVVDTNGDLIPEAMRIAKSCGRDENEILYFNPDLPDCLKFNPMAGLEIAVCERIVTTFSIMSKETDDIIREIRDQALRYAIMVLKRLDKAGSVEGEYATLINLDLLLSNRGGYGRMLIDKFVQLPCENDSIKEENREIAAWFLYQYFPENTFEHIKTASLRDQAAKLITDEALRRILNPDVQENEKNELDFEKHFKDKTVLFIATSHELPHELSLYLTSFILETLASNAFRRAADNQIPSLHFLYLDEFPAEAVTDDFVDLLLYAKSHNVVTTLAAQSIRHLAENDSKHNNFRSERIIANVRNLILFSGLDPEDAKYFACAFKEFYKELLVPPSEFYESDRADVLPNIIYRFLEDKASQPAKLGKTIGLCRQENS